MFTGARRGPTLEPPRVVERLIGGGHTRSRVGAAEALAVGLLGAAVVITSSWALRIPLLLGHDESVYALLARHWLRGGPVTGVADHRAPLLSALGVPILALGGGEGALRGLGVVAALASVVAVWWLGRMIHGPVAGLLAAVVFVFAPTVFEASTLYLTDLPAAAALVALAAVLWWQFAVRSQPDRRLLFAAPLAWLAYEFRYGSALGVVVLAATATVLFWPAIRRHGRLLLETGVLLGVLLLPHLVNATLDLGSPWGRLAYTSRVAGRDYLGQGLVEYVRWFPSELAGTPAAILMSLGLVGSIVVWSRPRDRRGADDRRPPGLAHGLAFLVVPAVAHVVAIGIASHGEPRFVFFPVALLCIAGAAIVAYGLRRLTRRSVPAAVLVLALLTVGMAVQATRLAPGQAGARAQAMQRDRIILEAAAALRARSSRDCSVLTSYVPQTTWYAWCASYDFATPPTTGRELQLTDDGWLLLFEQGKRQPVDDVLEYYLARAVEVESWDPPAEGLLGSAILYRMDTSAAGEPGQSAPSPTQPSAAMQYRSSSSSDTSRG